jgi:hypothetical protein
MGSKSNNVTGVLSGSAIERAAFQLIATVGRMFRLETAPFTLSVMDGLGGRDDFALALPRSRSLYVDGGTDTPLAQQNGASNAPFATIQQALTAAKPGTTIYVEPGPQTNIAAASAGLILSAVVVINVESTDGFPIAGTIPVNTSSGQQWVTYTGKTATQFTGVAGGVGPGTMNSNVPILGAYIENLVMPNVDRLSLLGTGPGVIITQPQAGGDTLSWVRTAVPGLPVINQFRMAQISLNNTSAVLTDACIRMDATLEAGPAFFGVMLFEFDNLQCVRTGVGATSAFFRRINRVTTRACAFVGGIVDVRNCSLVKFDVQTTGSQATLEYDVANPQPLQGRNDYVILNASIFNTVVLTGHPSFNRASLLGGGADTTIGTLVGIGLSIGAGGFAPGVYFFGEINAVGGVVLPLPSTATDLSIVDFRGARFRNLTGVANYINVTSAGPNVQPILAYGATFQLFTAAGLPTANAVVLDMNCSWNIRGGSFYSGQAIFPGAGPGTLDRDSWALYAKPNIAGAVVIAPAFPVGVVDYVVAPSVDTPANQVGITLKTAAGFTSTPIAPGGFVDFLLTRAA